LYLIIITFAVVWFAGSIALGQYVFPFSMHLPDDLPGGNLLCYNQYKFIARWCVFLQEM